MEFFLTFLFQNISMRNEYEIKLTFFLLCPLRPRGGGAKGLSGQNVSFFGTAPLTLLYKLSSNNKIHAP